MPKFLRNYWFPTAVVGTLLTALLLGGCYQNYGTKSNNAYNIDLVNKIANNQVVTVYMRGAGHCTGVMLDRETVATAAHCVGVLLNKFHSKISSWDEAATWITVKFRDTRSPKGIGVAEHQVGSIVGYGVPATAEDWAILKLKDPLPQNVYSSGDVKCNPTYITSAQTSLPGGTQIFHVGSPGESRVALTFGYISSYNTDGNTFGVWKGVVLGDIHGAPGSSGGPLFDKNGYLVGLVVAGGPSGLTSYVPLEKFIKECKTKTTFVPRVAPKAKLPKIKDAINEAL